MRATNSLRGTGVYTHNIPDQGSWFIGNPYAGGNRFVINRASGASFQEQAASQSSVVTNAMTIMTDGKVGIGTYTPTWPLHLNYPSTTGMLIEGGGTVVENVSLRLFDRGTAANNINRVEFGHADAGLNFVSGARISSTNPATNATTGAHLVFETAAASSLGSATWNTNQLFLSRNGNVGIETDNPTSFLTINTPFGTTHSEVTTGLHALSIGSQSNGAQRMSIGTDERIGGGYIKVGFQGGVGSNLLLHTDGSVNSKVGIGLTAPSAKLHVNSVSGGTTVVKVDGTSGELFTVVDDLSGSLFSVNDVSGIPVFETFADSTILMGNYQAPALFTTIKSTLTAGLTNQNIYQFSASTYTSATIEYNVVSSTNRRTGTITAIWNSTTIEFYETSTLDVGTTGTAAISLDVALSGTNVVLRATTLAGGGTWTVKALIRTI